MAYKILMVEDDSSIAAGLSYALEKEGYLVTLCRKISQAFEEIKTVHFDLALLDMRLPDGLGKEIGQKLLAEQTQVIYLTVVDDEDEIVRTRKTARPITSQNLFHEGTDGPDQKDIEYKNRGTAGYEDRGSGDRCKCRKGVCKDQQISLTALEYRLLLIFANQFSLHRRRLLERIWDISGDFCGDNTLTVYVKRLRKKLGDAVQISTVRGIGYRVDQ